MLKWFQKNPELKILIIICMVTLLVILFRRCTKEYLSGILPQWLRRKKDGDECNEDDKEDAKVLGGVTYKYDEDGDCKVVSCVTGYNLTGDTCVLDQPPDDDEDEDEDEEKTYTVTDNKRYQGTKVDGMIDGEWNTVDGCKELCNANENCKGFVRHKGNKKCYYKSTIPDNPIDLIPDNNNEWYQQN